MLIEFSMILQKFGVFNPANFARLSRDHFSIHLYNVAGRLVPILKRRSGTKTNRTEKVSERRRKNSNLPPLT
jgi:hypothetical protein